MIPKEIILIFIFYVLGDTITTHYGILSGGQEMNFVPAMILDINYGIFVLFGIKLIVMLWIWYCKNTICKDHKTCYNIAVFAVCLIGIVATVNNIYLCLESFHCQGHYCTLL